MEAQKWLEENYPDKKTNEIYLNQQLAGILDCSGYDKLREIYISYQVDSSKFEIKNSFYKLGIGRWGKTHKTEIIHCIHAREWLDKNYPKNGTCLRKKQEWNDEKEVYEEKNHSDYGTNRDQITYLNIMGESLEGSLDLSGFTNLEELLCYNNKLTSLNLSNCDKLKKLSCSHNHLTQIIYPSNPEQLTELLINNNNFPPQNLSIFSQFKNLKELFIGNNPFTGSLEPLQNLTKLKWLHISNTDLNIGIEYLPDSLERINYDTEDKPVSKVEEIVEQLNCFPKWVSRGFNGQQFKEWIDNGLQSSDYGFAYYLKQKGYHPQSTLNYAELRAEYDNKSKISQTWLDQSYPKEKRNEIGEIYITEQLEGELDLAEFTNLCGVKVLIFHPVEANKFAIKNQGGNVWIVKLVNAQEWLEENYPKNGVCQRETYDKNRRDKNEGWNNKGKKRSEIIKLDISSQNLEGDLDLSDFTNLKELICYNNKLKNYWQDIDTWFDYSEKKGWEEQGFTKEQTKQWIEEAGAWPRSYNYIIWLRDNKKVGLEWACNNKKEFADLQFRHWKYRLCKECDQPNTGQDWCQPCKAKHFQDEFSNWTSGNLNIDKFIQKYQLEATSPWNLLEWIPYEQFNNIEHLAEGGFSKIYKAQWGTEKDYAIDRMVDRMVALKSLTNSQNITTDFLQEIANHKLFSGDRSGDNSNSYHSIVNCHGISQDPNTKNYVMVMEYMDDGNLREYVQKNYNNSLLFDFRGKFGKLHNIAKGLKDIHYQGLVHRDFHTGNILNNNGNSSGYITDLGLARPASETNDEKIYGVLPYMAPEVLQEKPYTQKADIYSWGMVAYEMLTGCPPYFAQAHDINLALKVCQGLRPQFQIKIPQLLENLINRCWDADPEQRPAASELNKILDDLYYDLHKRKDAEFSQQIKEAEKHNQTLPDEIQYPTYQTKETVWHSKPINTKQIAQLLQDSKKQQEALELELKKLEKEIGRLFTDEQKKLVSDFIQARREMAENEDNDEEIKNKALELEDQLVEEKGFSQHEIDQIISYCDRLIKELEELQLQARVEAPTN